MIPSVGGWSEEGGSVQYGILSRADALLMGRATYDSFAPVFSAAAGDPVTDRMNALPKHVVSTTLTDPTWHNTHVVPGDPVAAVRALREQGGGDLLQYGFGPVARALLEADLLDELVLWIHPFLLGSGTAEDLLFRPGTTGRFELDGSAPLSNGIVVLTYRRLTG